MATGPLSIKLRCASWQQLSTIYKRDLSLGTMFLKAATPPPVGTAVRIDLTLPSASVIVLSGIVHQHVNDPQRGAGVELKLAPIPAGSIWLIESALASEAKRLATPAASPPVLTTGPMATLTEGEDVGSAEQDLIKALVSEAESLKRLNPFLVLGVRYEASDSDIRAAFGDLTKRYHPDRFARYESIELRQVAAEIFILIRDAYRKLGDQAARTLALASLGRGAAPPSSAVRSPPMPPPKRTPPLGSPASRPPEPKPTGPLPRLTTEPALKPPPGHQARIPTPPGGQPRVPIDAPHQPAGPQPRMAPDAAPRPVADPRSGPIPVVAQRSGPIKRIVDAAPEPTEVSESSALEVLLDGGRLDEAIASYKMLAKKHPQDRSFRAGIELCEGLRALTHRDRLEAAQRFEAALEIDPSNERAARELADMRRQATNERKGLLSRLMGKKES